MSGDDGWTTRETDIDANGNGAVHPKGIAVTSEPLDDRQRRTLTLEAFADTIVPGEKRSPQDRSVAGISEGGGAVQAGAVAVLESPEAGLAEALDDFARGLNEHADRYRVEFGLEADAGVPSFVALPAEHRTALVRILTAPGHPEKGQWVGMAMFCNMAFDTGPHMHTVDAIRDGHAGLTSLGFAKPDADGLWRFPESSYRRPLARLHPDTTSTGSPA
jgi:hypothetical protein